MLKNASKLQIIINELIRDGKRYKFEPAAFENPEVYTKSARFATK